MKTVNFLDLYKTNFSTHSLTAIYQTPIYRKLDTKDRTVNGFLLINKGCGRYSWGKNQSFDMKPQSLIYLPFHSVHNLTINTKDFAFFRISFTMTDAADGKTILFSRSPLPIADNIGSLFSKKAKTLCDILSAPDGSLRAFSLFYDMLSDLYSFLKTTSENKIMPAIDYINAHYTDNVSAFELAEMCHLSETHLYRLFKKETNKTPVDYRNFLRTQRACLLLKETDLPVSEIAYQLGFDSIYYFSRIFKKYMGLSPVMYIKNNLKKL